MLQLLRRLSRAAAWVAGAALLIPPLAAGGVRISEFQADNKTTMRDEDGDASDWIELFNPDDYFADITGCWLTDDPTLTRVWQLPVTIIPPRGTLLIWASGKDRRDPSGPLHTNFALKASGGYLALLNRDRTATISEIPAYPQQYPDRSWGISVPVKTRVRLVESAGCRWSVPGAAEPGLEWTHPDYDDSAWQEATGGIGYDRSPTPVDYLPHIGESGNTGERMYRAATTCRVRIPFDVASPVRAVSLRLRIRYDDGFAAFLNGVRLVPAEGVDTHAPEELTWNSSATAIHADRDAVVPKVIEFPGQANLLRAGRNVLAVQALNSDPASTDLLMAVSLETDDYDPSGLVRSGYLAVPGPGAINTERPVSGFVEPPEFSVSRGYHAKPFHVTLTTPTPDAVIRYTTDGSVPDAATGMEYTGPVEISGTTVLRAAAFRSGWLPSEVRTHTYLFASQLAEQPSRPPGFPREWGWMYNFVTGGLDPRVPVTADYAMDRDVTGSPDYRDLIVPALTSSLPVVSLTADRDEIFAQDGIYANGRLSRTEIPASVEFFSPDHLEEWHRNAGLRIHGGDAPLEHPKKPFRIYFRKRYGEGKLRVPLYADSPVAEFDVLQLRPGGHDGWAVPFGSSPNDLAYHATYLRDRFLRQTELDMGRLAPRGRYVHLILNGLYWGIYDLHEVPNADFYSSYAGGGKDDWDVVQHPRTSRETFGIVDGNRDALEELLQLCSDGSAFRNPDLYAEIRRFIDPAAFADHLIVQMWGAQNDWMGPVFRGTSNEDASRFFNKNWHAGRQSRGGADRPFLFHTWDAEISMGSHLASPSLVRGMRILDFDMTRIGTPAEEIPRQAGDPGPPALIYHALRQVPAFRTVMADRLQRHLFDGGVLSPEVARRRLDALAAELELPIVAESARWGDVNYGQPLNVTFTRDIHWRNEVNWLRDTYLTERNGHLLAQFSAIGIWQGPAAPVFSHPSGSLPPDGTLTISAGDDSGGEIYYTTDESDPMDARAGTRHELISGESSCHWLIPARQYSGNTWKETAPPGDIARWNTGAAAVGMDRPGGPYAPHILTDVSEMRNRNSSLYVRVPFQLPQDLREAMTLLTLRLKVDDGAFVFLNGSPPLARINAPVTSPAWDDRATEDRPSSRALPDQWIDLTEHIPLLQPGTNVLAVQVLNSSAEDESLLMVPRLVANVLPQGPPAPAGRLVEGPVKLAGAVTVKARTLRDGQWSPLREATFTAGNPAAAESLAISEILYHPVLTADERAAGFSAGDFEFIELMNVSTAPVDLAGVHFETAIDFAFPHGAPPLAPGARTVIVANADAFAFRHPDVPIGGEFASDRSLSNSGERVRLAGASGGVIADLTYSDRHPWPAAAAGGGYSLTLVHPLSRPDPSHPGNWRASTVLHGTPGGDDADTFDAWCLRHGLDPDPAADDDGNGTTRLVEYALGLFPGASAAEWITVTFDPFGIPVITLPRAPAADDVSAAAEMSVDLESWQTLTGLPAADGTGSHPAGRVFTFRAAPPPGTDRFFLRAAVRFRQPSAAP